MIKNENLSLKRRVGIYGGTFSPPHLGHVHAASAFLQEARLDELLIVPTFVTPLKMRAECTSPDDRLAMCRRAFDFSPKVSISDIEIRREGKSYTAETLLQLAKEDTRLVFLCGTDMFLTMDTWYDPKTIFRLAEIACMRREATVENTKALAIKAEEYKRKYGAEVAFLETLPKEMSSSEIRERLQRGESTEAYLPVSVAEYIKERGLYL